MKKYISIIFLITITLITVFSIDLEFGKPVNLEFANHYLNRGVDETGAMNLVASVYLDYRAYDTLIETIILFMAVYGISFFLWREK